MNKQIISNPNPFIFDPVTCDIKELIHNDSFCLQSAFFLDKINGPEINLTLTNLYIAVHLPTQHKCQYLYQTELSFELKFEVIYQLNGKTHDEPSAESKQIGFRLIKQGVAKAEFFTKCAALTDIWTRNLSKHINQYGFHKMYKPIKKLGKGGFATVYQVERNSDKKHFAVKAFVKKATILSENIVHRQNLLNEISMLRTFSCPNIIKCEGVFESQNSIYIILELIQYGQLHARINERNAIFSELEIKEFIRGMAVGLREMHQMRVMHRDIKPENIMLRESSGLSPVIVDFGLASDVDIEDYMFYRCGTPGYVAPQTTTLKKGEHVEPECDIFSLGAIFHILLTKRPLFEGKKCQQVYENNRKMKFNLDGQIYKGVNLQALDLLHMMLKQNPSERIKAAEILVHPYIAGSMEQEKYVLSPVSTLTSAKEINFSLAEYTF